MEEKVLQTIKKYKLINGGDRIIVGVSGGPDSIALLDILIKIHRAKEQNTMNPNNIKNEKIKKKEKYTKKELLTANVPDFEIIVVHINHQIREEANSDEEYVKNFCDKNNIKFYSKRIDVIKHANNNKIGLEEAGRELRYDFFDEIMKKEGANKIAIAHNKNDKAETIIMNILRGTGIAGLRGIEPMRDNKYIRPLIECERQEIEEYCKKNLLNPRIDKTNFENEYTRNKTRNIVLPYIKKEYNPNIVETLNRLSNIAGETENYLKKQTEEVFNQIKIEGKNIVLNLKEFNTEDILIRKRVLIYAISKVLGNTQNIEMVNIEDILTMCEKNIGNKYLKPNKNIKVSVNKGKIFFEALN